MHEFRDAFKAAKGYGHADSDEMNQAGTGINAMSREELEKGRFAGAGIKTKRQVREGRTLAPCVCFTRVGRALSFSML